MAAVTKSNVLPLLASVTTEKLPARFPVVLVRAIRWALLLTGVAEIPCDTQCFSTLSWSVIPRGILACGAAQAVAAAAALLLAGGPRPPRRSPRHISASSCLLACFVAVALFPPRDDGVMDIDGGAFGLFVLYGTGLGHLALRGFEAVRRGVE